MKNVRNWSISLLTFLSIAVLGFIGCQKTETATPTQITNGLGQIEPRDSPPKFSRGTIQFQWGKNDQYIVSESWRVEVPGKLTVDEKLAILEKAYNKIGVEQGTTQNKIDFKCAYDRAVNIIKTAGTIYPPYRSNNYVRDCCSSCADRIDGKGVRKARCDFQISSQYF